MNLSGARVTWGLSANATPSQTTNPSTGGNIRVGFPVETENFDSADVIYVTKLAGITDTINPTIVLATGVVTANGATVTGSNGEDVFCVAIPSISTGRAIAIKRTDTNGGTLSITGAPSGLSVPLVAGQWFILRTTAVITGDTLTFDNSTTAAATVEICVLGSDV